ncbi:MAG TPA: HAMP domain-containing sensor histidine kinase [Bryobacteraceae bacterium]|nr:HAMP domain-containing sensor histidine kinase [Bryobacteraceae bacterium]
MLDEQRGNSTHGRPHAWRSHLLWLCGVWVLPLCWFLRWILPASALAAGLVLAVACFLAPLPALLLSRRQRNHALTEARNAREEAEQLKLLLESVRYRTARLREELSAADQQARLSHQLTLLGQFTAGFMHEFNNPLAIVTSRIEVLLEERKEDAALCGDLQQMLKETRYMGNIARTLLQALRRERGSEVFAPSAPSEALEEALAALTSSANERGVRLVREIADVPRVNLPGHVVSEVVRGLLNNALDALKGREGATIWIRLEPYRTAGAKVVLRVEDNGPGVPESIREHLFEPFISQSPGRERLGLGLFLGASLLDMYDGRLWYEERSGGGASFVAEIPPARFTRGQPYHWFVGGNPS